MTRLGLVGYGGAGRTFHAPLITAAGLELAAVATAGPERVAQVRQDHPGTLVVPDLAGLLEVPDLDVVVLASPTGVHVEQARQVAEAGLAAVVDKPLAVDASGALEVCDAFAHEGTALTVFQNRRYDAEFRTLQAVLASGELGNIVRAELRWERWRPVPKDRWRENATADQGGGLLLDLFSHLVDQAVLLFGEVTTVYAELAAHTTTAEDTAFLSCRHASGVISHLGATTLAAAPGPRVRLLGDRAAYVLAAQRDEETAFTEFLPQDAAHAGWLMRGDTREQVPAQPGEPADFYREVAAALTDPDPQAAMPVDPRDSIHVLSVLDGARVSAAAGRVVEVITPGVVP